MITAIQVNYLQRGILGETEQRSDRRTYGITAKWVDKAIETVLRLGPKDGLAAAHFNHDDGSNDAIWQEYDQHGTRMLTWRHDVSEWSSDAPVSISAADFKRYIKKHLEGAA